jgi:hypothetical protein
MGSSSIRKGLITLTENEIIGKVADFYGVVKEIGDTVNVPCKNFLNRILSANAWYRTDFNQGSLSVKILEWRNLLALDNFLDSITINFDGRKVYQAEVHRDYVNEQRVKVFSKKSDWFGVVENILEEYN